MDTPIEEIAHPWSNWFLSEFRTSLCEICWWLKNDFYCVKTCIDANLFISGKLSIDTLHKLTINNI